MRLYGIAVEYRHAIDAHTQEDGTLSADLEKYLDCLDGMLASKAEAIAALVQEAIREGDAIKAEADRLANNARVCFNRAERLKKYLFDCMTVAQCDRVQGDLFKIAIQRNGRPSIRWNGLVDDAPKEFVETTRRIDGEAAYQAYRAGVLPDGFTVEVGSHLRIR